MMAMLLGMTSCGNMMMPAGGSQTTTAAGSQQAATGLGEMLMGLLSGSLIPTESQIVGTWVYQSPAVIFTSQNALSNLGGAVASSGIEQKLQSYLSKYGITSGNTTITFNKDKTFSANIKGKVVNGTYTINGQTVSMTFAGSNQPSRLTPQLNNGTLVIAGDATKIMTFAQGLGANSSNQDIAAISSIMNQFNGMQLGIRLQKK